MGELCRSRLRPEAGRWHAARSGVSHVSRAGLSVPDPVCARLCARHLQEPHARGHESRAGGARFHPRRDGVARPAVWALGTVARRDRSGARASGDRRLHALRAGLRRRRRSARPARHAGAVRHWLRGDRPQAGAERRRRARRASLSRVDRRIRGRRLSGGRHQGAPSSRWSRRAGDDRTALRRTGRIVRQGVAAGGGLLADGPCGCDPSS